MAAGGTEVVQLDQLKDALTGGGNLNIFEYFPKTPEVHNSIYRGKNITSKFQDGSLFDEIASGTFDDIWVGDYFTASVKGIQGTITNATTNVVGTTAISRTFRIMHLDLMYQKGDSSLSRHHAVIMPDTDFGTCPMNATNTTSGGYVASDMYKKCIPLVDDNLEAVFGTHLIQFRSIFTNAANTSGATSSSWYYCKSFLLNEVEIYGSIVFSSSGQDVGTGNTQFSAFRLNPRLINYERNESWLRSVGTSPTFCLVNSYGASSVGSASARNGVRPAFIIR